MAARLALFVLANLLLKNGSFAFLPSKQQGRHSKNYNLFMTKNQEDSSPPPKNQERSITENYLDDLTPPPINFKRDSILFSENPSTMARNNAAKEFWELCRDLLPPIITGVWPWRDSIVADKQPVSALYNMAFVRIPVIVIAMAYTQHHVLEGNPLIMDLGDGPWAIPPFVVYAVICLVLA